MYDLFYFSVKKFRGHVKLNVDYFSNVPSCNQDIKISKLFVVTLMQITIMFT